jgi:TRAP-type C4-dicarboxylate transport system substrate-binding protein
MLMRYSPKKLHALRALWIPILFLLGVGWLTPQTADAQISVKMATLVPKDSSWHRILLECADQWNKLSGGKVRIIIYAGGTQGDDPDIVRKMNLHILDAALLTSVGIAEIDKSVYALSVPMMYNDYGEVYSVLEKMRPHLESAMEAKGFVVLNWADAGWLHFFTKKPVAAPDDLEKLALFQWAGDPRTLEIWRSAGFNPRPGASTELATGLQTGLYEAFTASPQVAVITGYFTNAKYMTDLDWALLLGATVIRKEVWDRIPANIKPALMRAQLEAAQKLQADIRQSTVRDIQSMKARGLTVVPVDARLRDEWRAVVDKATSKIRGDFAPADAYDEALKFRDEYRQQKAAKK